MKINIGQKFCFEKDWKGLILDKIFPWCSLVIIKHEYTVEKKAIIKNINEKIDLLKTKPNINNNSAQNLLAGGTPIFIVIIKAQNNLKIGNKFIFPLDKIIDREPVNS